MIDAIRKFIGKVPKGAYFDTHTVIEYLMQKYPDIYLSSFSGGSARSYHGSIGKLIKKEFRGVVVHMGTSISKNIKDEYSKCALWKKEE